ncbi:MULTISPECIES: radical SAM/SPASM domain-containing protein [unclassified Sedimentibacter]|uniref:radical SAM/SPASM domain-containing protein n=1 Tax=unclassified Sedimentibacter TaxID=2649220 RepID=UPI0027E0199B|nr:radical SAM protein [Sedimentibacter sp. MB35-C1]WMJ77207.1 SPASM domain-containing protein [Sedimentibacter sp. MB35-C1]
MFNRKYAFDYNTNFIFSIDELSEKILNNTLDEHDKERFDIDIVERKKKFIKFLCDKGIISNGKPSLNNHNSKFQISTISLFLTNNCNLRCKYCYEKNLYKTNNMSKDVVKSSVDLLFNNLDEKTVPTISLFGGEPLLNIELIEYIKSYVKLQKLSNCRFSITTNGTVMNNKIYSLLNDLGTKIMLSLDGSKEKQDYNRKFENGIGSYDKVKSNIDEYLQQDMSDIVIRNTITKNDVDYKNTYDFFKTSGYKNLISIPISTSDEDEKLNKDDINKLIGNCKMIAEDVLNNILAGKEFLNINFFNYGKIYNNIDNSYCGAGLRSIAIDTNGDIYHCHRFVGDSTYKLGNVVRGVDNDLITTMQSYYYNRLNDVLMNCKDCWAFNLCKGGCMHENLLEGNSINKTNHELCNLRRSWFEITIALYAMICEKEPTLIEKVYGESVFNNKINKWIPLNIN